MLTADHATHHDYLRKGFMYLHLAGLVTEHLWQDVFTGLLSNLRGNITDRTINNLTKVAEH